MSSRAQYVACGSCIPQESDVLLNDPPRLLIASGEAITQNLRRIVDIQTITALNNIYVFWKVTSDSAKAIPCCMFTLLETYPLNNSGRKITGESIVLLKLNTTDYTINTSHILPITGVLEYLICLRLFHRSAGKERKLDETCTKSKFLTAESSSNVVMIVFAAAVAVNILLILGLMLGYVVKYRRTSSGLAVKSWWNDASEALQKQS